MFLSQESMPIFFSLCTEDINNDKKQFDNMV